MKLYMTQMKPVRGGVWIGMVGKAGEIRDYVRAKKKTARSERTAS